MNIRQVLTPLEQPVSLPTVDVINGTPSLIAEKLKDRAGYPDIRNFAYKLLDSKGDSMNFLVTGQVLIAQSVPETSDPAVPAEVQPTSAVTTTGDAE